MNDFICREIKLKIFCVLYDFDIGKFEQQVFLLLQLSLSIQSVQAFDLNG